MTAPWLVTGGTGFLGRHIGQVLKAKRIECKLWGREACDLMSPTITLREFQKLRPEVVVHAAAACGGIGANMKSPWAFWHDNLQMGMSVFNAALASGVRRIALIGTTCSYPANGAIPFREDELFDGYPEVTNAPYAIAKRSLIVGGMAYSKQFGVEVVAAMPTNLYGPWDNFDLETSHVIPAMIRKMAEAVSRKKSMVELWGSGEVSRDFLYVEDAAAGIVDIAMRASNRSIINLGSGEEVTIKTLARVVAKAVGYHGHFKHDTTKPDGQRRRLLDISKAKKLLGWEPATDLVTGIAKTYEWVKGHQEVRLS